MKTMKTFAGTLVALVGIAGSALAADFPTKGVEFIVPYPPGGASNFIGRAIAQAMTKDLGQEVTVLNRAGGAGTVGAAELARKAPDGYTIGLMTSTPLLMKPQTSKLPYDLSSFTLLCRGFDNPLILTVSASSGITSLEQLVEKAKKAPGSVKYYTEGPGTLQDIAMGRLQEVGGFKAIGVPMTGFQAATQNLLSGVIDVAPVTADVVLGNPDLLKPIAVMAREPIPAVAVPTVGKVLGKPVVYSLTGAVVAPKGLPEDVKKRLVESCAVAQKDAEFNALLTKYDMPPVSQSGQAFAEAFQEEYDNIGAYIQQHKQGAKN